MGNNDSIRTKNKEIILINNQNKNNDNIYEYFKSLDIVNKNTFISAHEAIYYLKKISFKDIIIVISESLVKNFIEEFKNNLCDLFIIPKIIVLLNDKQKYINENDEFIKNNPFYFNFMATNLEEIKNILLKTKNEKDKKNFCFGYLFNQSDEKFYDFHNNIYKEEFLKFVNEKYSKNLSNNNGIIQLINQIQSVDNIPLELLSKYYVRIYTLESDFYRDINESLAENKILYYLPYIKVLYEGIKLKSLLTSTYKILYNYIFQIMNFN